MTDAENDVEEMGVTDVNATPSVASSIYTENEKTVVNGRTTTTVKATMYDDGDETRPVISTTIVTDQNKVNLRGDTKFESNTTESAIHNYTSNQFTNTNFGHSTSYRADGSKKMHTEFHSEDHTSNPLATNVAAGHNEADKSGYSTETKILYDSDGHIIKTAEHTRGYSPSYNSSQDVVENESNFTNVKATADGKTTRLNISQSKNGKTYEAQITSDQTSYSYMGNRNVYDIRDRDGVLTATKMRRDTDASKELGRFETQIIHGWMERKANQAVRAATEGQYRNVDSYVDGVGMPTGSTRKLSDGFDASSNAISSAREQIDAQNQPQIEADRAMSPEMLVAQKLGERNGR